MSIGSLNNFRGVITNLFVQWTSVFQRMAEGVKFATGYLRQDTFELNGVTLGGYRRLWGQGAFVPGPFWGGGWRGMEKTSTTAYELIYKGRFKDALLELFNYPIDAWSFSMVRAGATAFNRLENFHGTLTLLSKIKLQDWNVRMFNSAGIAFNRTKQFDKTIALFEYLPREQWDGRIITAAAVAYAQLGRYDDAMALFSGEINARQREHVVEATRRLHGEKDRYPKVGPLLGAIKLQRIKI